MKIFEIKVEITKNLGNYENEKVGLSAQVEEGESAQSCISRLKDIAWGRESKEPVQMELIPAAKTTETKTVETKAPETKPKETKKPKAKEEAKVEEKAAPTEVKEEAKVEEKAAPPEVETKKTDEEKAEKPPVKEEVAEPKGRARLKASSYDRSNELHKKFIGEFLDKEFPTWRTDTSKARKASEILNGKDFLDAEGMMLESFKEEFRKIMKG